MFLVRCAGGGEEHGRRRREAEGGLVMFGEMIAVEAGAVAGLQHGEAIFILHGDRLAGAIHVIEDSEFHFRPSPALVRGIGWANR